MSLYTLMVSLSNHEPLSGGLIFPPSLKLRRTAVALAEAGPADLLAVRLKPDTTYKPKAL